MHWKNIRRSVTALSALAALFWLSTASCQAQCRGGGQQSLRSIPQQQRQLQSGLLPQQNALLQQQLQSSLLSTLPQQTNAVLTSLQPQQNAMLVALQNQNAQLMAVLQAQQDQIDKLTADLKKEKKKNPALQARFDIVKKDNKDDKADDK